MTIRFLENHGALSRVKVQTGFFNQGKYDSVSGHVLMVKIKKVLTREFTQENFDQYAAAKKLSEKTKLTKGEKIDRSISRLDMLPARSLKLIYDVYENRGVMAMIDVIDYNLSILTSPDKLEQRINKNMLNLSPYGKRLAPLHSKGHLQGSLKAECDSV